MNHDFVEYLASNPGYQLCLPKYYFSSTKQGYIELFRLNYMLLTTQDVPLCLWHMKGQIHIKMGRFNPSCALKGRDFSLLPFLRELTLEKCNYRFFLCL